MKTSLLIVIGALGIYYLIRWLSQRATITIPTACAGNPRNSLPALVTVPAYYYPIQTYLDGKKIGVFRLTKMIIKGKSLEKLGVKDESLVYVSRLSSKGESSLKEAIGKFVIFNIDNERIAIEHPLDVGYINMPKYKARKVINILDKNLSKEDLLQNLKFLKDIDNDSKDPSIDIEGKIFEKYKFASNYYTNVDKLIVSITYRNEGRYLGVSFHSPDFLYGIIKYIINPNNSKNLN